MPLQFIRPVSPDALLGCWDLEEPADLLRAQLLLLAPADLLLPKFSSASRQQQWLGGRLLAYTLLRELTDARPQLLARPGEKPYFESGGWQLSVSHTRRQVVAILSRSAAVGIDIETLAPKVLRVTDKFLTPAEQEAAGGDLTRTLIYWCTKETLYKLHGRKQMLFKEHFQVQPFGLLAAGSLQASICTPDFQKDYTVYYEVGTDFILTYCLDTPA